MSGVSVMFLDGHGRVVRTNEAAEAKFGACVGRRCADVVGFKDASGNGVCSTTCSCEIVAGGENDVSGRTGTGKNGRLVCVGGEGQGVVMVLPDQAPTTSDIALSPREREVLELVAAGLSAREIARRLGIGFWTVRTHLDHAKEKLGVSKSTELVSRAIALGLLAPTARK
ncbi:MAG: LuxR C-terminal-related transcriptional regulator [Myxococcota bacterium]